MFTPSQSHITFYKNALIDETHSNFFFIIPPYEYRKKEIICTQQKKYINNLINLIYKHYPKSHISFFQTITKDNLYTTFMVIQCAHNTKRILQMNNRQIISFVFNKFVSLFATTEEKTDYTSISNDAQKIYQIIQQYVIIPDSNIIVNLYINRLYPSFNISLTSPLSMNKDIVSNKLTQSVKTHLTYFDMLNTGIKKLQKQHFVLKQTIHTKKKQKKKTKKKEKALSQQDIIKQYPDISYGVMLVIQYCPDDINPIDFLFTIENVTINIAMPKNLDKKIVVNNSKYDSATTILITMSMSILITAPTIEKLNQYKQDIIAKLEACDIITMISPRQSYEFINGYNRYTPSLYPMIVDIKR